MPFKSRNVTDPLVYVVSLFASPLIPVCAPPAAATEAVITPALAPVPRPNETPFALLNVNADAFVDVVLALMLILLIVAAFDCIAVVMYAGTPTDSPLVFNVPTTAVPAVVVLVNPVFANTDEDCDCIAVVRNAGKFKLSPDELAVTDTPLAVSAVLVPMKSEPRLLAMAVVRYAPCDW
jgi:hypothetical protein